MIASALDRSLPRGKLEERFRAYAPPGMRKGTTRRSHIKIAEALPPMLDIAIEAEVKRMHLSFKLFLEDEGRYVLGPGRVELLRLVEELGSLRKAAQKQGMSYRWAWGRLKDAEKALGIELLTQTGIPGEGKAKVLTPEARELLAWLAATERGLDQALEQALSGRPAFLAGAAHRAEGGASPAPLRKQSGSGNR